MSFFMLSPFLHLLPGTCLSLLGLPVLPITRPPITPLSSSHSSSASLSLSLAAANKKQQPLDAAVLYLFSPHCQLLCAQHVCGSGGGKLPQVSPAAGGGRSPDKGGETAEATGEKEEK